MIRWNIFCCSIGIRYEKGYKGWQKHVENVNNKFSHKFPTRIALSQGLQRWISCEILMGKIWNGRREKVKWEIKIFLCVRWYFEANENFAVKNE